MAGSSLGGGGTLVWTLTHAFFCSSGALDFHLTAAFIFGALCGMKWGVSLCLGLYAL